MIEEYRKAIDDYSRMVTEHNRPDLMSRIANLHFQIADTMWTEYFTSPLEMQPQCDESKQLIQDASAEEKAGISILEELIAKGSTQLNIDVARRLAGFSENLFSADNQGVAELHKSLHYYDSAMQCGDTDYSEEIQQHVVRYICNLKNSVSLLQESIDELSKLDRNMAIFESILSLMESQASYLYELAIASRDEESAKSALSIIKYVIRGYKTVISSGNTPAEDALERVYVLRSRILEKFGEAP